MGRHRRTGPPDDGAPDARAFRSRSSGAPAGPPYDLYSGPTDDRVYVSHDDRITTGPAPGPERAKGPPDRRLFEPLPGDYPGDYPGAPDLRFDDAPDPLPDPPDLRTRADKPAGRRQLGFLSALPVPLMPILALIVAVGIVSYALSTQQISLNFAGGTPNDSQTDQRDSQVTQQGPGERASRGAERADGLLIAFKVTSRTESGFKATATIANRSDRPVEQWALAFRIPSASVTAVSGATAVRGGETPLIRGRAGIAPGEKVRFVFAAEGTPARPTSCVLNRRPCVIV